MRSRIFRELRSPDGAKHVAVALESSLRSATALLYEEMVAVREELLHLREQQAALVLGFEQMQRNHTKQLKMLRRACSSRYAFYCGVCRE